jgi:hypothetical protein
MAFLLMRQSRKTNNTQQLYKNLDQDKDATSRLNQLGYSPTPYPVNMNVAPTPYPVTNSPVNLTPTPYQPINPTMNVAPYQPINSTMNPAPYQNNIEADPFDIITATFGISGQANPPPNSDNPNPPSSGYQYSPGTYLQPPVIPVDPYGLGQQGKSS